MVDRGDVCVLIPTYNEAATIGDVVSEFRERGFENVLVVDGHSTDDTVAIAREDGAHVVEQSGQGRGAGKGQAVREGVARSTAPYLLMLDGDGTYRPADADALLEPLLSGEADHVVGDRYADMADGAMTRFNGVGNRLINRAFRSIHGRDVGDVLSGYRAFTRESFEQCNPAADGFGIETELAVECVKHGVPITVVPIEYHARPENSETNLRPVRDGAKILLTLYRLAKTNNPLFYFGSAGVLSGVAGVVVAAYVFVEWVTLRVSHEVLAVAAAFAIIVGVQLVIFGVLSDMILAINREQTRRFEALLDREATDRPRTNDRYRRPGSSTERVGSADERDRSPKRDPSADPPAERVGAERD